MTNASFIADFNKSIGINTSITMISSSYQNYAQMMNALNYLGITNIRDTYDNPYATTEFGLMANQLHLKFDFFIALGSASPQWQLSQIASNPGIAAYVEGYNESDSWWQTYNGLTGIAATRAVQQDIYAFVKSTPSLVNVGVLQATFANQTVSYPLYGNLSSYADYASTHSYFGTGNPPGGGVQSLIDTAQIATPGKPTITTESGYFTMPGSVHGVSETVQAKYTLNLLFDQAKAGVSLTYLWELADNYADPANSNSEDHFGLFNYDWTPKLAALALHNLGQIMQDSSSGSASLGNLNFAFSTLPSTTQTMLYQKSDGTFVLVVCNDVRLSGPTVQADTIIPPVATTLQLGQDFARISVFDPLTGTDAIETAQNASSINLQILDHPVIIELNQNTTAAPAIASISAPSQIITTTGQSVYVDGLSIAPSKSGSLTVMLTSNGFGMTINDRAGHVLTQNTNRLVLSGSVGDVDAELASLRYMAMAGITDDMIAVTLTDAIGTSSTRVISVSVVASPSPSNSGGPTLSSPANLSATTNSKLTIPQLFIADAYASTHPEMLTLTISTTGGILQTQTSQANVTGNSSKLLTAVGSFNQISTVLSSLNYTGLTVGQDTIKFTVKDQSNFTSIDSTIVNISSPVNAPQPTITTITGNVDGGVTLKGRSTPNSTITILDKVGGVSAIFGDAAAVGSNGAWSFTSHTKLNTSTINTFLVSATDSAGNVGSMPGALFLTDTGVDQLTATAGVSEIYAIMSFKGSDIIQGFQTASSVGTMHDYINFSGRGISSFAQVHSMMSGSTSTILSIGSGKTVTLSGVAPTSLTANDFLFS